ncbi:MAG: YggT family protein [Gemmatimonadetes bacterium]|nr:YggT family protein [Gemmatimonadota bacterium]
MLDTVISAADLVLALLRPLVFAAGAATAVVALVSWSARTRRISPFSWGAQLLRRRVDPWLIAPMERRLVRAGGTPASAPWWVLAVVVVGGLLLLSLVELVRDELVRLAMAAGSGATLLAVLVRWTFTVLRVALVARVVASWVGGSPYQRGWRWAFQCTEWLLAPLRQLMPPLGPFDLSVLVAYFALGLVEGLLIRVLL